MNVCGQAFSTLDPPARYIPGYFALPSPKPTQSIELDWLLDENAGPIHDPSTLTPQSENLPLRTTRTTLTPTSRHTSKFPLSLNNSSTYDANPPLLLVEHANRAEIHRRQKRVESELSEALKGDIEWVRSGGVLRDSNGRRDFARTERIRDQLDEQERERRVLAAWTEYEDRWRACLAIGGDRRMNSRSDSTDDRHAQDEGIGFRDVAWPMAKPPRDPEGLSVGAVREFVLSPLRVKGATPSKRKDRIRQLLLRYHPDKTAFLLSRVKEEEKDLVREGVNNVFVGLKSLQGDPELQDSR